MYGALDISTSALVAQRIRLDVIAANIANQRTILNENDEYEPGSPFADADGYVSYPNVNSVIETMNAMDAARAYEANITAIEATKSMLSVALQIIA